MATYVHWFLWALCLMALEMATGTFYLLVLGVAMGVGGIAALLGLALPLQFTLAAVAGIVGTVLLRHIKSAQPNETPDQSLDIGQPVQVVSWREDGTARVFYRGAEWDAEPEPKSDSDSDSESDSESDSNSAETPRGITLYIKALRGSTLILTHRKP
jgi:membrane protein implicated in regulation of membrane protease activity